MSDTITKPNFSEEECKSLVLSEWGLVVDRISSLPSYDDLNFCIWCQDKRFVVKFFHAEVSVSMMSLQEGVMLRLRQHDISAPFPVATKSSLLHVLHKGHLVRLLEWVEGEDWAVLSPQERLSCAEELGALAGRVDCALSGWRSGGGGEEREWVWRTSDAWMVETKRGVVERRQGQRRAQDMTRVLEQLKEGIKEGGWLQKQPMGIIHGDVNDHNTIIRRGDDGVAHVSGVIDLGDVCVERYCFSLGNTLFYAMLNLPLDMVLPVARSVARGYIRCNPVMKDTRAAWLGAKLRCVVSATMSGVSQEAQPDNEYVGETEKPGWTLLDYIVDIPDLEL